MVSKFFDKQSTSFANKSAKGSGIKSMSHQQLAHEPIIRKFTKTKVYSSFKENN